MKRIDLVPLIGDTASSRGASWALVRQGGDHEVWALNGRAIAIPRHREIRERLAETILRTTESELGSRWWRR